MKRPASGAPAWLIPVALLAVMAVIAVVLLAQTRERDFADMADLDRAGVTGADLQFEGEGGGEVELDAEETAALLERLRALRCRGGAEPLAMQNTYARVRLNTASGSWGEIILSPGAMLFHCYGEGKVRRLEISSGAEELEAFINGLA